MNLLVKPPFLLRRFYSRFLWKMPGDDKKIFFTFDDGPIPEVTEFVLDTLKEFDAKATFFCLGKNVATNPKLYQRLFDEGHTTGNHTHNHFNGWNTPTTAYLADVKLAETYIQSPLFRPPYGRIRLAQADALAEKYKIVMWDVLSYDFNNEISPERCMKNVTENVRHGSIIVFHDSQKAYKNLKYALPRCLETFRMLGYTFDSLK